MKIKHFIRCMVCLSVTKGQNTAVTNGLALQPAGVPYGEGPPPYKL